MYDKIKNKFMFSLKSKVFSIALLIVGVIFAPQLTQAKTIDLGVVGDTVRIPGTILNSSLSGSGNRCLYVDSSGNLSVKGFDCGSASGGDDMGSHSATQNIRLNTFWLSGDGDNEGIYVTSNGSVGIGTTAPGYKLDVVGDIRARGNVYTDINYGNGLVGVYSATRYQGVFAMGNSYKLSADGTSPGTLYGIAWTHSNMGGQSKSGLSHQALFMTNGVTQTAIGTGIWTLGGYTQIGASSNTFTGATTFTQPVTVGAPTASTHAATKSYVDATIPPSLWSGTLNGNIWNGTAGVGNVGIGTTAPTQKLDVSGVITAVTGFRVNNAVASSGQYLRGNGTNFIASTIQASDIPTLPSDRISGLGSLATQSSVTDAQVPNNITIDYATAAGTATSLAANGANCSAGSYPLGINASGAVENCTPVPTGSDIYWTGTPTNLVASTARTSLGLGSLATLSSVTSAYISNGTIVDADISASTDIAASKIQYGDYFITSAGTSGQVWTSDGSGVGGWAAASGGLSGSGTANYVSKWTGTGSQGNSLIYDNGTNLGIANTSPGARLQINAGTGEALRLVTNASYSPLNIRNSANTADIFRVDQNGSLAVGTVPVARVSGLGSLATLSSVTSAYITNSTIVDADISASTDIAASKIQYGDYFITSAGTSGQVWTSDGSGVGAWAAASGALPTGTNNSTLKYSGLYGWQSSSLLNNDGSSVNINYNFTNTCTNTKLGVNGSINANSLYLSNITSGSCAAGANIAYDSGTAVLNFSGVVDGYYFSAPIRPIDGTVSSPALTFNNDTDTGIYRSTTNTMDFATAGARRMTIASNGSVGINATSPSQKLEVGGYAKATGFCIGASCITSWPSGGGLSGSGTSGYISKWSGSTSLNSSVIYQNSTSIGIGTTNPGSYKLYVNGATYVNGGITATEFLYSSDLRLKDNIKTIDQALEKILSLRGVSFSWKNNDSLNLGLIAQEVEQVFPELVVEQDGYKAVQYGNLVAPLIEAIKEQQRQIKDLNQRINQLEMINK